MAVTVIATAGAADANSYATLAEANAYHEAHTRATTWTAVTVTDDMKNRALVQATRLLDEHVEWKGYAATTSQRLCWPRNGMYDRNGNYIQAGVIPEGLKFATAELARQLIAADRAADSAVETQGVTRLVAGPVELEFERSRAKVIPDAVFYMVDLWGRIRTRAGAINVELTRS